jgi:flagellar protein FlaF
VHSNQLRAYESVSKATGTGREIEADVLTKAALRLKECQNNWQAPDCRQKLDTALKFNQRIWSIFQSELAQKDHPLPTDLKIDLLRLSSFIDRRTFEVLAHPTPEKLSAIININLNIAAGLRLRPARASEEIASTAGI